MEAAVLIVFALGAGFAAGWMVREARVRAPDRVAGHLAEMVLEVAAARILSQDLDQITGRGSLCSAQGHRTPREKT